MNAKRPVTRFLSIVLAIVATRWLDARTGWPDYATLPVGGVVGVAVLDFIALNPDERLTPRGWTLVLVASAVLGAIVYAAGAR